MFRFDARKNTSTNVSHALMILLMALLISTVAGPFPADAQDMGNLSIVAGKSIVLRSDDQVRRVSISDPAIADFVLISPNEIYITGRAAGATNMIVWQDRGRYSIYDVEVGYDVARLKQRMHEILPQETDLRITALHDTITLSGRVSDAASLDQALTLTRAFVSRGKEDEEEVRHKVRNLVEVRGIQQVMLEVRVAEMQRSLVRRLGINFNYLTDAGSFGISKLAGLTELVKPGDANIGSGGPFGILVSPSVNALFRFSSGSTTWTGFIDALKQDGLVKILAEPTLIALSGHGATFHAGGEVPIPVSEGLGTVSIIYKEFGVKLGFLPTVLADNKINIQVSPEVSELDFANAVAFGGFVIPALSTRKATTVVELADGQSFAIAGLLRESVRDASSKFPLLGDIPILGALFRSKAFQKNETELIIIATPRLVKPVDTAIRPLPTDYYIEPNDAEFYLLGRMEGGARGGSAKGELDGEFGHAMPARR